MANVNTWTAPKIIRGVSSSLLNGFCPRSIAPSWCCSLGLHMLKQLFRLVRVARRVPARVIRGPAGIGFSLAHCFSE